MRFHALKVPKQAEAKMDGVINKDVKGSSTKHDTSTNSGNYYGQNLFSSQSGLILKLLLD